MIRSFFNQFDLFSQEEITAFSPLFHSRTIPKNTFFIQEGEKCTSIAFIESGIFRSYYLTPQGDEVTYCFRFPNELLAPYSAFITGNPSIESIQAITSTTVTLISISDFKDLVSKNPKWEIFLKIIAEQNYLEMEHRIFQLQYTQAKEKYSLLLKKQPEYILAIPLQYLASYLGISQRHLSRIRKEI